MRPSDLPSRAPLAVIDLGLRPYTEVLELQRATARSVIDGTIPHDVLLLVEHPPVVTLGRSSRDAHLLASTEMLRERGVDVLEVERGGDVTFHGPGQLVGYPILDLKRHKQDLHWYLRQLEAVLIATLKVHGIVGARREKYTGVWVEQPRLRKIASIGVHARDWVTWHGFALNVSTELSWFDLMIPCGIADVEMTSMCRELNRVDLDPAKVAPDLVDAFASAFGVEALPQSSEALGAFVARPE